MIKNRERILNKIKTSLGRSKDRSKLEIDVLEKRLKRTGKNLIPKRAIIEKNKLLEAFVNSAKDVASSVVVIEDISKIPEEIVDYLKINNIASRIVVLPNEEIDFVNWDKHPTLDVVKKCADEMDETVLVSSYAAIAETGTVVQLSSPENPITSHFLPDNSIVLIKASRILPSAEDVFELLRKENKDIPRSMTLISGPSRTGDIALNIEMGAHGPRKVHLLILNDK